MKCARPECVAEARHVEVGHPAQFCSVACRKSAYAEKSRTNLRKSRAEKKARGECSQCHLPVVEGKTRCAVHHASHLQEYHDDPEAHSARMIANYRKNHEVRKAAALVYHFAHRDERLVKMSAYLKTPAGKIADQLHHQRRRCALGICTSNQLRARVEMFGGRCWIPGCGKTYEAVDHVIPLSRGGTNWPANLRPICKRHNSQKHAKNWRVFLAEVS